MNSPNSTTGIDRFTLVTSGHHFLMDVLPFRDPESHAALATFVAAIEPMRRPSPDVDAVLLRCLVVLDTHHEQRIPSLVDRYLAMASTREESVAQFRTCVEDLLRNRCIRDRAVQQAVETIGTMYVDSSLDSRAVAGRLGLRLSTLDAAFRREMDCSIAEHIRGARLDRAAILLVTTNKTIKQIWAEVGYNHPSNFDHDFKRRFEVTPREFREGSIRPLAQAHYGVVKTPDEKAAPTRVSDSTRILVVDDDETTRWTLSVQLGRQGYSVSSAACGMEGLICAKNLSPDVILLDNRLGDMDGLQFLRVLRSSTPTFPPAVVLFTADWNAFEIREDFDALDAVVVSKLCDLNQVIQRIECLASKRGVAPRMRQGAHRVRQATPQRSALRNALD